MSESQYSSSSNSSNNYVSGGSAYQTPSYGQTTYKTTEVTGGLSGSGVKDNSYTSTTYGTTGVISYGTSGITGNTSYGTLGATTGSKVTGQATTTTY